MLSPSCELFVDERVCGSPRDVRRYLVGLRCSEHVPAEASTPPSCTCPLRCYAHDERTPMPLPSSQRVELPAAAPSYDYRLTRWLDAAKHHVMTRARSGESLRVGTLIAHVGVPPVTDDEIERAHQINRAICGARHQPHPLSTRDDALRTAELRRVEQLLRDAQQHGVVEQTARDEWRGKT